MCEPWALRYLSRESLSRTAAAEMPSSPGSIPRSLRTPTSYGGASIAVSMRRTVDSVLSIDVSFQMPFGLGGGRAGNALPPAFEWARLGIYHLSEMCGALFDTPFRTF